MFRLFLIILIGAASATAVCAQEGDLRRGVGDDDSVRVSMSDSGRATADLRSDWNSVKNVLAEGNADSLAALFAADGFILRPGHPPVQGRAAIADAYRGAGGPLHLRATAYAQEDTVGYIIGGYRYGPEPPDTGKFILTLRRTSGDRWYITADMDNSNR